MLRWQGPDDFAVLCTIESLSLLYLLCWVRGLSCKPNICVSWSTSELRVRLAPRIQFKSGSKLFLLTVPRRYFFCRSFVLFISCVCHAFASVHCYLVVICWERADLLALVCDVYCVFVTFPCGILGQVWYLIVSFPDLCRLSYFYTQKNNWQISRFKFISNIQYNKKNYTKYTRIA